MDWKEIVFGLKSETDFDRAARSVFEHQYRQNRIYRRYVDAIGKEPGAISHYSEIPFLPVSFFRTHDVLTEGSIPEKVFLSSGTTGAERSRHLVADLTVYLESLRKGFRLFYGPVYEYDVFALTPDPVQNPGSSLVFMIADWIRESRSDRSGFYLGRQEELAKALSHPPRVGRKQILIGLSYALLDFSERFPVAANEVIIMETGGMKGRRREMVREELHALLSERLRCRSIHSEYGMTELLSQAYSAGDGRFQAPPWMKVRIRDLNDPLEFVTRGKTGGICIIDLANFNSCSFIAVQDIGKVNDDGTFEVLGRFDYSDLRGCSLMIS